MTEQNKTGPGVREGFISGLPIVFGYFPVAMAFGLLARNVDVSLLDNSLFSIMVFAGASQFMALDLIKAGVEAGNIIIAVFLLNLRHMMMSASLSVHLKDIKKRWLYLIAFGVTDETFSVASLKEGKINVPFLISLQGVSYLAWVSGTVAGYFVGPILPAAVQNSLGIGLYAMFAAILTPQIRKSINVFLLSIISAIIYISITYFKIVPASWSLVVTIIAASAMGVLLFKDDTKEAGV
jgi:4-azaleucine resistance transporter AzlC